VTRRAVQQWCCRVETAAGALVAVFLLKVGHFQPGEPYVQGSGALSSSNMCARTALLSADQTDLNI